MFTAESMISGMENMLKDLVDSDSMFHLREEKRAFAAHVFRIALHDFQVCANGLGQICFVNHEQIGLSDSRPTFARDFVTPRDVNHLDGIVGELAAETRS
jgi:hypothetical protein